jgi:hypothetical protein
MSDGTFQIDLSQYVRYVADCMRLRDWSFDVVEDPAVDALASIQIAPRRRFAVIRLGELFTYASDEDRRHAVVHELAHAHLQGLRDHAETLDGQIMAGMLAMFRAGHDQQIETAADEFAAIVAPQVLTPEQWMREVEPEVTDASREESERPGGGDLLSQQRPAAVPGAKQAMRLRNRR